MNLTLIRERIAERLTTIPGLRAAPRWPDTIHPPVACVRADHGLFHQAIGEVHTVNLEVVILAAPTQQSVDQAQELLDAYLNDTDQHSVKNALRAEKTLGGAATTLRVLGWREYGEIVVQGISYWGVVVDVEVFP